MAKKQPTYSCDNASQAKKYYQSSDEFVNVTLSTFCRRSSWVHQSVIFSFIGNSLRIQSNLVVFDKDPVEAQFYWGRLKTVH